MNFTGSVIVGLLYVLPGILFVSGLTRLFSTRVPSPFDGQLSSGFILALPAALFMHAIGIAVAFLSASFFNSPQPDAAQALILLLGDPKADATSKAVANAGEYWFVISVYFLLLGLFSYGSGKLANKFIKPRRRADWFDLLRHNADLLWLTTDMQIGGVAYLFAGMLIDFRISSDGVLERVVLRGSVRRTLKRPSDTEIGSGDENYQDGGWVPIPGEFVVLEMKNSHTVNVDYWYLELDQKESLLAPPLEGGTQA